MAKLLRCGFYLSFLAVFMAGQAIATTHKPAPAGKPELREIRRADNSLSHCVVDQAYANGMHFSIARNSDGRMNLGITMPGSGFKVGAHYPMQLELSGTAAQAVKATARTADVLFIAIDDAWRAQLAQATQLTVVGRVNRMEFALPYATAMAQQLAQCGQENTLPPPVLALLQAAGIQDAAPLDLTAAPDGQDVADYAWRTGNLTGGVRQRLVAPQADFAAIVTAQIAALKQNCHDTWHESVTALAGFGAAQQQQALLTCARKDGGAVMGVVLHQDAAGRFSIISHAGGLADKEQVQAVTAKLAGALDAGAQR